MKPKLNHLAIEQGFTLLELLIALAAGIILIAALSEALIIVKAGWNSVTTIDLQWSEELQAQQLITRMLESAIPPDANHPSTLFNGSENGLEFSTMPAQSAFALGSWKGIILFQAETDGLYELKLSLKNTVSDIQSFKTKKPTWILLKGINTYKIVYFANKNCKGSLFWRSQNKLPELIKISLGFADSSRKPITIVAHPQQSISGNCLIDMTSFECRYF